MPQVPLPLCPYLAVYPKVMGWSPPWAHIDSRHHSLRSLFCVWRQSGVLEVQQWCQGNSTLPCLPCLECTCEWAGGSFCGTKANLWGSKVSDRMESVMKVRKQACMLASMRLFLKTGLSQTCQNMKHLFCIGPHEKPAVIRADTDLSRLRDKQKVFKVRKGVLSVLCVPWYLASNIM